MQMNLRHSSLSSRLNLDIPLVFALITLFLISMTVIYSASGQSSALLMRHGINLAISVLALLFFANIPSKMYEHNATLVFIFMVFILFLVPLFGETSKGAQRWLDLGIIRFQPSEIMKLAMPLMVAKFMADKPLPPSFSRLLGGCFIILIPTLLIGIQPDLGTALLVGASGVFVIFLSGIKKRIIFSIITLGLLFIPIFWLFFMHDYQKTRVLTLFNPESDPLGAGYHIIQSKIAIGSGGWFGKGWMAGTQSQLEFLPERHTDFIFSVFAEEFGFFGFLFLIGIYLFIILRSLHLASNSNHPFSRLVIGSIALTFFSYIFVNIGMVSGLLPVVGVPLPLISYGGTSMVSIMSSFGILMSMCSSNNLTRR